MRGLLPHRDFEKRRATVSKISRATWTSPPWGRPGFAVGRPGEEVEMRIEGRFSTKRSRNRAAVIEPAKEPFEIWLTSAMREESISS